MRAGFAGTPDFAVRALAALHASGHTIPLVLTQPDRPFGRGLETRGSPVKRYALAHALPLVQPAALASASTPALLETPLDVLVVAAYGLILPRAVLAWPRCGCLNIHASLLPRWRGAAPIPRAIEAGDTVSGITIMQMEAGLDTGPMILRREIAIDPRETAGTLHDKLADAGARAIVDVLRDLARDGHLTATAQPDTGVSYAAKIGRADTPVDWTASAAAIDRRIRALVPAPGASARFQGAEVKLRAAVPIDGPAPEGSAGVVVAAGASGIDVACGTARERGLLRLTELQPASGRTMSAAAYAAGRHIVPGSRFDAGIA
jgi:methionyl-tRNA formyltransferase